MVNLVVELIHGWNVEETLEQPAVDTLEAPVIHQGEGPRASHPEINYRLSA